MKETIARFLVEIIIGSMEFLQNENTFIFLMAKNMKFYNSKLEKIPNLNSNQIVANSEINIALLLRQGCNERSDIC